jgi:hypothetical protein
MERENNIIGQDTKGLALFIATLGLLLQKDTLYLPLGGYLFGGMSADR